MRNSFSSLFASLLIFLYIYTASNKLLDMHSFKTVLSKSPLIGNNAALLSWTIPAIEFIISLFLLLPRFRRQGFLFSSVLMLSFTIYIGYMVLFVPDLPCSCGGVISGLTWPQHLLFNLVFLAISIAGFFHSKRQNKFLLQ